MIMALGFANCDLAQQVHEFWKEMEWMAKHHRLLRIPTSSAPSPIFP